MEEKKNELKDTINFLFFTFFENLRENLKHL